MKQVSAIICTYNEAETIEDVIIFLSISKIVNEIIVVNDGSTDNTENIIKRVKKHINIKDIHFKENKGKGYAMATGVENATNEIVVFVDADQTVIVDGYVEQIVKCLLSEESDMVLGYSTVKFLTKDINPLKILTGERALYKKDVFPILDKMKESRFGVETLLYFYFISIGKSIKFIKLVGLKHKTKYEKNSIAKATINYVKEGWEIAHTAGKNHDLMLKSIKKSINKKRNI